MVTTFYPPYSFGGDAIFVYHLSNELARRGHTVDVIHCVDAYRALGGKDNVAGWEDDPQVRVHALQSKAGVLWPLAMHQSGGPAWEAARVRALLEGDFDVIHYHNISLMGGPEILTYGSAIKLYTMHEFWLVCPTHVLYRFDDQPCESPSCVRCTLSHGRPPQLWRYGGRLQDALHHVDILFALSRFSADAHRSRGVSGNFRLLPPFAPRAAEADRPSERGEPYFLYAGRLEKIKGLQTVIPQFRGSSGAQLWVAGAGSQEAELRRMAADLPRVRFLGHVREPQLSMLYRDAIAAIVPSLCYDMFPLVALEAFRQKTPVVVRNIGGLPEIAERSGGCLTFSGAEDLAGALDLLMENQPLRDQLGQRGFAAYKKYWTPEAHLESYLSAIQEIASARTAAAQGA